jgi:hypothetical protein
MPLLIFLTIVSISYVLIAEIEDKKGRTALQRQLLVVGLVGFVISFMILTYLIAQYTPVEDAFPGSDNL